MRIATWNINSVRARTGQLLSWLASRQPDVLCLQELKCLDEQFPAAEIAAAGYQLACHGQKTYNGVAILSREPLAEVVRGLQDGVEDPQSRLIAATVGGVRIVCAYVPNGQAPDSPAYHYKLAWFGRLRRYLELRHRPDQPLLLCGDMNVAPEPRDVHDPALWEGHTLFTLPERAALAHVVGWGLTDLFRLHHPEAGRYTWWDYRMLGFPKNLGLRLDHMFGTAPLAAACRACDIDREARKGVKPSDHAPVWIEVDLPAGSRQGGQGS